MAVSRKRKISEMCGEDETSPTFPLNDLNQDLLERVLSWLPASSFFRLTSVCKRWKSVATSAAFLVACRRLPPRRPWFFMLDSPSHQSPHPIVFDSDEGNWKQLRRPQDQESEIPVAAAAGLLCFLRPDGGFTINNPLTGSRRHIHPPPTASPQQMRAIAMAPAGEGFKIVTVSGDLPNLEFTQFSSVTQQWEEEITLAAASAAAGGGGDADECSPYFLSKCGNVVSTHIQRSPSKQYSSVLIEEEGGEMLYYLSASGTVVACDLRRRSFMEYPRLLPVFCEYSIDLVECGGRMCVVLLSEFLETASVRVWRWEGSGGCWRQAAAMPAWMSHGLYGEKADINCTGGGGETMMVCVNLGESCRYVMCDMGGNGWTELPSCSVGGRRKEFVSALSFEPRIEAR